MEKKDSILDNTVKAENQVNISRQIFTLGSPEAPNRIAIFGNSITLHGELAEIGWFNHHGMAASCPEKDYVHRLERMLNADGNKWQMIVCQIADWECKLTDYDFSVLNVEREFAPDVILFRAGENVDMSTDSELFKEVLDAFLTYVNPKGGKVLLTTCFWRHKSVDPAILKLSKEKNLPVVELGELGDNPEMKAIGLFEHSGVAAHPGDLGMEKIAEAIFDKLTDEQYI